ncbi:23S rRNA (uracil1939-C5)-methyltransferase [Ruminococcaceae bacterium FB2012]|nr:23S rRNA (uracil1939-C5)-methyltransferase [Ruminococcaceae bacterium FB2012]
MKNKHIVTDPKTGEKRCTCFKRCGGCQLDMTYSQQLERKQQKAERMLSRFCKVNPIIGMETPYNYRNKVQTVFGYDSRRQLISGVYQSNSGRLTATEDCMLEDRTCTKAVLAFKRLMKSFRLTPYDPVSGKGFVRHLLTRYSASTGQLMVCVCASGSAFPSAKAFASELKKACPVLTSFVLNVSDKTLPLSLGERDIVLYGSGHIEDVILGKRFIISPRSFYQVNSVQTEKLYSLAAELADLRISDVLIDAYCGTGTIGIICADKVSRVLGTELNPAACRDARENLRLNGITNYTTVNEDAGKFMRSLAAEKTHIDTVITDPPRAGCDRRFFDSLIALSPRRTVYISCKIESLERDLKYLTKSGYKVTAIQPVDMFPHTVGIETVSLLEKI